MPELHTECRFLRLLLERPDYKAAIVIVSYRHNGYCYYSPFSTAKALSLMLQLHPSPKDIASYCLSSTTFRTTTFHKSHTRLPFFTATQTNTNPDGYCLGTEILCSLSYHTVSSKSNTGPVSHQFLRTPIMPSLQAPHTLTPTASAGDDQTVFKCRCPIPHQQLIKSALLSTPPFLAAPPCRRQRTTLNICVY